jgi:hypothetical protein
MSILVLAKYKLYYYGVVVGRVWWIRWENQTEGIVETKRHCCTKKRRGTTENDRHQHSPIHVKRHPPIQSYEAFFLLM